ncbi:variable large family protein (plasmid) [Borrelia coriaceae]|uniref:Variable large protein n=1 Tax=Borrelia coriaceae ATCC 43381 TaxID=1408429 RepID=W5SXD9_9SPIR|nr:variable large family protein [Borrelia coriaceae]AHH11348.1 Variable major outer membrane lipoprotein [Borrelia coriaceae ATCC 43381]UPA17525.1 variable large family protein [Borrelia coriaceae]
MKINIKNIRVKSICATLFISLFLSLIIGCSQQADSKPQDMAADNNNLINLLDKAGETFFGFLDLVAGSMGFTVTKDTTKKQVGEHFDGLSKQIQVVLEKLKQIITKEGDSQKSKGDILSRTVNKANETLIKLVENLSLLAKIGGDETLKIGEVDSNKQGAQADDVELKKAYEALTGIIKAAESVSINEPKKSSVELTDTGIASLQQDGAKVLASDTSNPTAGDSGKAAAIVSTVTGSEMLAEIFNSKEADAKTGISGGQASAGTSALSFARGGQSATNVAKAGIKPGAVSAGIALRSLVKGGKLASDSAGTDNKAVQLVGVAAASKLVGAVETLIMKTVNKVLEEVKQAITTAKSKTKDLDNMYK